MLFLVLPAIVSPAIQDVIESRARLGGPDASQGHVARDAEDGLTFGAGPLSSEFLPRMVHDDKPVAGLEGADLRAGNRPLFGIDHGDRDRARRAQHDARGRVRLAGKITQRPNAQPGLILGQKEGVNLPSRQMEREVPRGVGERRRVGIPLADRRSEHLGVGYRRPYLIHNGSANRKCRLFTACWRRRLTIGGLRRRD